MAGSVLHGAFIQFTKAFLVPVPNIIIFQFNPETITHTWSPAQRPGKESEVSNPLAVRGMPGETFSFTLQMNANETISDGSGLSQKLAEDTGIYSRLAALELLLFPEPQSGSLLGAAGAAMASAKVAAGAADIGLDIEKTETPLMQLPVVLWVWGPGRVLPVKVTSLTITEKLYSADLLNPVYAEAQVSVATVTPEEIGFIRGPAAPIAKIAYNYSQTLREALAIGNLANAGLAPIGALPV